MHERHHAKARRPWTIGCYLDTIVISIRETPWPAWDFHLIKRFIVLYRELLSGWIGQYGYLGIFSSLVLGIVGLPIPDEFLLILSGYFVFKNVLDWAPTVGVAILGTFCGILASYALGRLSGRCIHRFDSKGRLKTVRRFFERFGRWTFVFGYLVPGVRNLAGLSAGASKLRLGSFAPYAFLGAVFSSVICVTFGYIFGPQAEWVFLSIQRNLVLALIAGLSVWLVRRRFRQLPTQQENNPGDTC